MNQVWRGQLLLQANLLSYRGLLLTPHSAVAHIVQNDMVLKDPTTDDCLPLCAFKADIVGAAFTAKVILFVPKYFSNAFRQSLPITTTMGEHISRDKDIDLLVQQKP